MGTGRVINIRIFFYLHSKLPEDFDLAEDDLTPFKTDNKNSYFMASVLSSVVTGEEDAFCLKNQEVRQIKAN